MKLSIVIPVFNEEESIAETIDRIDQVLSREKIEHEIFVVNDNSTDGSLEVLKGLAKKYPSLIFETNHGPNGFGYAVRYGLERFSGDCVAVMMGDLSDSPEDLLHFYVTMKEKNVDCVFGDRWTKESSVINYPFKKRVLNRVANRLVRFVMNIKYNDTTNAFKLYKRHVIAGVKPILSPHFNLTIELPLKAIIRGFSYTIVPNSWVNRKHGESKLNINEMGSRYFFILMYCLIEKFFSKGDFKKKW